MTEQQLHQEVNTYEGFLNFVSPINEIERDTELEYLERVEKEIKMEGGENNDN